MAKLLVVEDNPQNLKLAQLLLQRAGHEVLTATDGEAGLMQARQGRPDMVLMDVQMPGLDGLQVTRQLKADPATAHIKVIALTALAMKGDAERILQAGCDAYLAKPFQYAELVAVVDKVLT
ncbi:response regulator [Rhizobacter sp. LjRoot28]|uniref:response regulator n=1 Tax=Rhizobacter sp. LjRoot28 TaxID=3342309 RepID=UPI003ECD5EEF